MPADTATPPPAWMQTEEAAAEATPVPTATAVPTATPEPTPELRREALDENTIRETWVDANGKPVACEEGWVIRVLKMNMERITAENWYDADGNPTTCGDTYSQVEYTYDKQGNVNRVKYFDGTGAPIRCRAGYSIVYREFDGMNRVVYEKFFDVDGFAIALEDGTVSYRYEYDLNGELIKTTRYDYFDKEIK